MEIKNFGSLRLDGTLAPEWVDYSDLVSGAKKLLKRKISFGDSLPGLAQIQWVKVGKIWVSTKVFCLNISREELNAADYLYGRPVRIDGVPYICRSIDLTPTFADEIRTEWTDILNATAGSSSIWDTDTCGFWGQGSNTAGLSYLVKPSLTNPKNLYDAGKNDRDPNVGFRPVLESLKQEPVVDKSLLGEMVVAYHGGTGICGRLHDFSDYDLVLDAGEASYNGKMYKEFACIIGGKIAVVDRTAVDYLQKEPEVPQYYG